MKLIITQQSQKHINYLLGRYKGTEWSGPAFYSVKYDEDGFPEEWTLRGFVTLDLGDTTSTEWDGEDWVKISKEIYDKHPDYQKCFMGLIHSHHGMGEYFSGTDRQQLEEAANKVGYPSLVVAHTKTKFAFGISYLDNFNQIQLVETKEIEVKTPKVKPLDEWVKYADEMDKKQRKSPNVFYNGFGRNKPGVGQRTLWGGFYEDNASKKEETTTVWLEAKYEQVEKEMTQAEANLENGKISKKKYNKIKKRFDKISKEYVETFGETPDEMDSWNDSFGLLS